MSKVYTLTLNSAIEEVVFGVGDTPDKITKINQSNLYLTGKAVNTGLLLSNIQTCCDMSIVCGYDTFEDYKNLENDYRHVTVFPVEGITRRNQTLVLSNGREFRIINKGYTLTNEVLDEVYNYVVNSVRTDDIVLIAGSLPGGVSPEWYLNLIRSLKDKNVRVMFDASNDELREGIKGAPFYIKPNSEEIKSLIGEYRIVDLPNYIRRISEHYNVQNVVVTLGENGALGYNAKRNLCVKTYSNNSFKKEIMTTGCGDSFNAGFIYAILNEYDFANAMVFGTAFAEANIIAGFPEKVNMEIIQNQLKQVFYKTL